MDTTEVITALRKRGFFEAYKKTVFTGYRNTDEGAEQKVELIFLDAGENETRDRYTCTAIAVEFGKKSTGNAHSSISGALSNVHWNELD
jgi:hypothetical protein